MRRRTAIDRLNSIIDVVLLPAWKEHLNKRST
jgi:hypothetical protein